MSGSVLSIPEAPPVTRPRLRRGLARLGVAISAAAALVVAIGLCGGLSGWADLANHFSILWFLAALAGGMLSALAASGPGRPGLILAAIALVGSGAPVAAEALAARGETGQAFAASTRSLRVLTFNVWDGNLTTGEAAEVIRRSGADLVAVEEPTRLMQVSYPGLASLYPYASPCRRGCDVAVLSKRPLRNLRMMSNWAPGSPKDIGRPNTVVAETEGPDGAMLTIAATHLVWPTPPATQAMQRVRLADELDLADRQRGILLGDFNLTPWSFAMRGLDRDLKPMSRRTRAVLSYPSRLAGRNALPFLAIDQVFAGPAWRTTRVERLSRGGSDHFPVLATLEPR